MGVAESDFILEKQSLSDVVENSGQALFLCQNIKLKEKVRWRKNESEKSSIRNLILVLVIMCWVLPVVAVFIFTALSYRMEITKRTDAMIENEMQNISSLVSGRLDDLIESCLQISYERSCEKAWRDYKKGIKTKTSLSIRLQFYRSNSLIWTEDLKCLPFMRRTFPIDCL